MFFFPEQVRWQKISVQACLSSKSEPSNPICSFPEFSFRTRNLELARNISIDALESDLGVLVISKGLKSIKKHVFSSLTSYFAFWSFFFDGNWILTSDHRSARRSLRYVRCMAVILSVCPKSDII